MYFFIPRNESLLMISPENFYLPGGLSIYSWVTQLRDKCIVCLVNVPILYFDGVLGLVCAMFWYTYGCNLAHGFGYSRFCFCFCDYFLEIKKCKIRGVVKVNFLCMQVAKIFKIWFVFSLVSFIKYVCCISLMGLITLCQS